MADDKPEDAGLAPEFGRAKRAPPTIDLEATEVSTQPQDAAGEPEAQPSAEQATLRAGRVSRKPRLRKPSLRKPSLSRSASRRRPRLRPQPFLPGSLRHFPVPSQRRL